MNNHQSFTVSVCALPLLRECWSSISLCKKNRPNTKIILQRTCTLLPIHAHTLALDYHMWGQLETGADYPANSVKAMEKTRKHQSQLWKIINYLTLLWLIHQLTSEERKNYQLPHVCNGCPFQVQCQFTRVCTKVHCCVQHIIHIV